MRAVIQRTGKAAVRVGGETVARIDHGFLVLLGVAGSDGEAHATLLAKKTASLRVFRDDADKMNLSLPDVGGAALVVSQFTLYADTTRGNRPSFVAAAPPEHANRLYEFYCRELARHGVREVAKGVFGAMMEVSLVNDGPVTICLDTDDWNIR